MRVQKSSRMESNRIEDENENLASGAIRDDRLSGKLYTHRPVRISNSPPR